MTASVVVAADHLLRGMFWPLSVYGVQAATAWRALEHAGWVVFEDVFLVVSIQRSLAATQQMAERRAEIEASHDVVENQVQVRTTELRTSEGRFRSLCASSPVGIFETDPTGARVYANRWIALTGLTRRPRLRQGRGHPSVGRATTSAWLEAIKSGRISSGVRVRRPDGTLRWAHAPIPHHPEHDAPQSATGH